MVTAATQELEPAWLQQLSEGGILIIPLAFAPGLAYVMRGTLSGGLFVGQLTRPAYFMPLRSEEEALSSREEGYPVSFPAQSVSPPWSDWGEQKRFRASLPNLLPALAFFAMLRGQRVSYQALEGDRSAYRVVAEDGACECWLSARNWAVSGPNGTDLARGLWRDFLDLGAPRPTEYRVRVVVGEQPLPKGEQASWVRKGAKNEQSWDLPHTRDRPLCS
jgi:hypothetical protein